MSCILAAVDGSVLSLKAAECAAELAAQLECKLTICHVVDLAKAAAMTCGEAQLVGGCLAELGAEGKSIVQTAANHVRPIAPDVETRIAQGTPIEQIVKLSDQLDAQWIVMGTHGRTGLSHTLLGSVAEGVVRRARVPVIVVPWRAYPRLSRESEVAAS
jgi:glycine betaine transporter